MRLLLFADPDFESSMRMLVATLQEASARDDIEVAAVIELLPRMIVLLPFPVVFAPTTTELLSDAVSAAVW